MLSKAVLSNSFASAICHCAGAGAGAIAEAARALGSLAPLLHLVTGALQALAVQARDMMPNSCHCYYSDTRHLDIHSRPSLQSPATMAAFHCSDEAVCDWCLQALELHRATAKLGYIVTALFAGLLEQGFCVPDATREGVRCVLTARLYMLTLPLDMGLRT